MNFVIINAYSSIENPGEGRSVTMALLGRGRGDGVED